MRFVLVDDNKAHNSVLQSRVEALCGELGILCEIVLVGHRWQEAVDYARKDPPDTVYFLDIELSDEINGIDLCRQVRELNPGGIIVYVSAYQQYALLCCQSHAFDFLLKPWTDEQLSDCLSAIRREMMRRRADPSLEVRLGTRLLRLPYPQVLYFSKNGMSLIAHCAGGHELSWRENAEDLMKRLPEGLFTQTHKSYIVSLGHVQEFRWSDDQVILDDGTALPISRRRMPALKMLMEGAAQTAKGGI